MATDDGGPVFTGATSTPGDIFHCAMSLRDYFAAHALVALIAKPSGGQDEGLSMAAQINNYVTSPTAPGTAAWHAKAAYALADAMLAEREKQKR